LFGEILNGNEYKKPVFDRKPAQFKQKMEMNAEL